MANNENDINNLAARVARTRTGNAQVTCLMNTKISRNDVRFAQMGLYWFTTIRGHAYVTQAYGQPIARFHDRTL